MKQNKDAKNEPTDEQMYSAISFCVVLVLLGIPLWWKTTEVYRVTLPYSEIDHLHQLNIKVHMNIHVVTIDQIKGMALVKDLRNFFEISSKIYNVSFKQHSVNKELLGSSKSLENIENKIKHPHFEGSLQLFEVPGLSRFTPKNIILGQNRTIYFSSDTGAINLYNFLSKKILNENFLMETLSEINLPAQSNFNKNIRQNIPLSSDIDILFTVLNPDPESLTVKFNINEAVQDYFSPFILQLEDMYHFHVKSQWLYFVNLQAQMKFINHTDTGPHFALASELLPHIITPLEKKLASHVSKYPCLNFVLYIPPCSASPLHIYIKKGFQVEKANSFISPKWGGVQIYNPDRESCGSQSNGWVEIDQQESMTMFLQQFKILLGIGDIEEDEQINSNNQMKLWQKDSLLRMKTVQQLTSSKLTLQSLSKLLGKINNIVINDQVGEAIKSSLQSIYEASAALESGNLLGSYVASKKAFTASEKAFTDPSLLALLYFPDDQKYAVYIPLFLPVMIPVLMSFRHIAQWAANKSKKGTKSKTE